MELEFDKEIDALLRKARPNKAVLVGDALAPHLDADEIAAFAENAVPQLSRAVYLRHFADCDNCRTILSNLISLNAEAEPEPAFVAAPAVTESAIPWYRRLFLFPNLAYVMGGLVVIFSGFLGYIALQGTLGDRSTEVSQVAEEAPRSTASGPNLGDEQPFPYSESANANASNAVSNRTQTTNTASTNTVAKTAVQPASPVAADTADVTAGASTLNEAERRKDEDKSLLLDGVSVAAPPPVAAPQSKENPKIEKDDALQKKQDSRLASAAELSREERAADTKMRQMKPDGGRAATSNKPVGPSRDYDAQFPNRAQNQYEVAITREVGGRTFERNGGVWYDTAYRGQGTTNVRRGTDAYKKLDSGLRSIAETLSGTVIVVWGGKAYRIQ